MGKGRSKGASNPIANENWEGNRWNKADWGNKAVEHFDSGYNCAESVFKALCEAIARKPTPVWFRGSEAVWAGSIPLRRPIGAVAALGLWVDRPSQGKTKERAGITIS